MTRLLKISFCLLFCLSLWPLFSQTLNSEEQKLYDIIMAYRKSKGLPVIPLSKDLTTVAQTHVRDLNLNKPDCGECNAHSWSDKGNWTACCYTSDHKQAACLWDKPRELTNYKGDGFEIACGSNGCCPNFNMTADYALESWKKSPGHHALIINTGSWKREWKAIGIGLDGAFAVVWFGRE
jgi:hypothetical protein